MLKSPFQFGDRPQFFFITITIPSTKLCYSPCDLHYAYFKWCFAYQTRYNHVDFITDIPRIKTLNSILMQTKEFFITKKALCVYNLWSFASDFFYTADN